MKILFKINHPAHYHLLKITMSNLKQLGHQVFIIARRKDVLESLLINEDYQILKTCKGKNIFDKFVK